MSALEKPQVAPLRGANGEENSNTFLQVPAHKPPACHHGITDHGDSRHHVPMAHGDLATPPHSYCRPAPATDMQLIILSCIRAIKESESVL